MWNQVCGGMSVVSVMDLSTKGVRAERFAGKVTVESESDVQWRNQVCIVETKTCWFWCSLYLFYGRSQDFAQVLQRFYTNLFTAMICDLFTDL